eukprot:757254-Prorocentrum_lima.AAC.1
MDGVLSARRPQRLSEGQAKVSPVLTFVRTVSSPCPWSPPEALTGQLSKPPLMKLGINRQISNFNAC